MPVFTVVESRSLRLNPVADDREADINADGSQPPLNAATPKCVALITMGAASR